MASSALEHKNRRDVTVLLQVVIEPKCDDAFFPTALFRGRRRSSLDHQQTNGTCGFDDPQ